MMFLLLSTFNLIETIVKWNVRIGRSRDRAEVFVKNSLPVIIFILDNYSCLVLGASFYENGLILIRTCTITDMVIT